MLKTQKLMAILIGAVVILAILTGAVLFATSTIIYSKGTLYIQDATYAPSTPDDHGITTGCMAMSPECGVCPLLHGDTCYTPLRLGIMNT